MCNQEKYPLRRGVVVVNDRKISYNTFKKKDHGVFIVTVQTYSCITNVQ